MSGEKYEVFAGKHCGGQRPLEVCQSAAGFYLGTRTPEGEPNTRESAEYWPKRQQAEAALLGRRKWTQRLEL